MPCIVIAWPVINIKYDPYKTSSAWPPDEMRLYLTQGAPVCDAERQMLDKSVYPTTNTDEVYNFSFI